MKRSWIAVILVLCLALSAAGIAFFQHQQSRDVIIAQDFSMDNTDFAYYYWSEYFYLAEALGPYLKDRVDFAKPLDAQPYDAAMSWQDYLIESTLDTVWDTLVMVLEANAQGFTLPPDYDGQYQKQLVEFADAATRAGCEDLEDYLRDSYGKHATVESFSQYLHNTHLAAAYADHLMEQIEISDEAVLEQFRLHRDDYVEVYGFDPEKPEDWMETVRQELQTEEYQNAFREIQSRRVRQLKVNRENIQIVPPKGLYE